MVDGGSTVLRRLRLALVLACLPCLAASARAADAPTQELTLHLTQIEVKNMATSLRTIADVKHLRGTDDHTIVIKGTPETLDLAKAVTNIADTSDATDERLDVGDGTVIFCVALENASAVDVMKTLMNRLRIARQATLGEKRLLLRDTKEQITAALAVINELDSPAAH